MDKFLKFVMCDMLIGLLTFTLVSTGIVVF